MRITLLILWDKREVISIFLYDGLGNLVDIQNNLTVGSLRREMANRLSSSNKSLYASESSLSNLTTEYNK